MNVYFRSICVISIILFHLQGQAQSNTGDPLRYPILTLRTNPLSVLERDGNLGLGIGYQPFPKWAFTLEPAYIFFSTHNSTDNRNLSSLSGIKIRADVRYYLNRENRGLFIGPEFHYKNVSNDEVDDFGFNCVGMQCAFFQRAIYQKRKREAGFSFKLGSVLGLSRRLSTEIFLGIGVKYKKFTRTGLPNGAIFLDDPDQRDFFIFNTEQNGKYFMLPAGAKLLYHFQ